MRTQYLMNNVSVMFFTRFLTIALCLYFALAIDLNYPSTTSVKGNILCWLKSKAITHDIPNIILVSCASKDSETYIRIGQKYYFKGLRKVNWFDAAQICRRFGGDLALFETAEELKLLSDYLLNEGTNGNNWYWISGNDLVETHKFTSITSGLPLPYLAWSVGQPDNPNVERCVHLWYKEGSFKMNNYECTKGAYFLCQRQNYTRCWDNNQ